MMGFWEFAISAVALGLLYRFVVVVMRHRSGLPDRPAGHVDELQIIQEIHQGLARMEQRIEALETLLADQLAEQKTNTGDRRSSTQGS